MPPKSISPTVVAKLLTISILNFFPQLACGFLRAGPVKTFRLEGVELPPISDNSRLTITQIAGKYHNSLLNEPQDSDGLLAFFDFNGVLATKTASRDPTSLEMDEVRHFLYALADARETTVFVSSSKPASRLVGLVGGHDGAVGLSAEHSMSVRSPKDQHFQSPDDGSGRSVAGYAEQLLNQVADRVVKELGMKLKTGDHEFSRNFISQHGLKELDVSDVNKIINEVQSKFTNHGHFEATLIRKNDSEDEHAKEQITVASKLKGKEKLVQEVLQSKNWNMGIAVGDKDADLKMLQEMKHKGFMPVLVGKKSAESARQYNFFHLEGPGDVLHMIGILTAVREYHYRSSVAAEYTLQRYVPNFFK